MDIRTYVNPVAMRSAASSRGAGRAQRVAPSHNWGDGVDIRNSLPSLPSLEGLTPAHMAQDARRLDALHPVMQPRVQGFTQAARMAGYPVVITPTGGYRPAEEVADKPEEALHQTGLAVDYGFIDPNGKLRYQPTDSESMDLARIANRFGLSWGSQPGARSSAAPTHLQWNGAPLQADAERLIQGRQEEVEGRNYPQLPSQMALEDQSRRDSFRALNQFADDLSQGRRARGQAAPAGDYLKLNDDERRRLLQGLSDIHQTSRIHQVMGLGLEVSRDAQGLRKFIDTEVPGLLPQAPPSTATPGAPLRMDALADALATSKYGEDLDLTA